MTDTNPSHLSRVPEPPVSVAIGGLLLVVFGTLAVLTATGMGWVGAATLGVVLLVVAWRVPVSPSAAVLRFLMAGFGAMALLGATYDLLTR